MTHNGNARPRSSSAKAHLVGGGIGSLAAAAFMIRDGGMVARNITIYERMPVVGGSMDAAGNAHDGYKMRGGRMLTFDNYECMWGLYKTIPSLTSPGLSVYEETVAFNKLHPSRASARLVDKNRAIIDSAHMGFSMRDREELFALLAASEEHLGATRVIDWLAPAFVDTKFWYMWDTTFAFQPWHSAVEFKRYLQRFMMEFSRIDTMAGVKRTRFNQYEAMIRPLEHWLAERGVTVVADCTVMDIDIADRDETTTVTAILLMREGVSQTIAVGAADLVFLQNGSMTDASTFGSMTVAPPRQTKAESGGWILWEKLATGRPQFGRPATFNTTISESLWESFTLTCKDTAFFDAMHEFCGYVPGSGGLVTFKDSSWLMSVVLYEQPHYVDQPENVQVAWGYALHPDRVGNFVAKPMSDCTGAEILRELRGHLNFDEVVFANAVCIPCRMPYITSMFMPRHTSDRPEPVPRGSTNLAFVSQFVEIPDDVVFTVEYSIRAAQIAVYSLLAVPMTVPPITRHDHEIGVTFQALAEVFK